MKIDKIAEIWTTGVQVRLILHTPNNKAIVNIEESPFFDRLAYFQEKKFTLDSINYFEGLQEEIKDYCECECFYTDDGDDALRLDFYVYYGVI